MSPNQNHYDRATVEQIVKSVIAKMEGGSKNDVMIQELKGLLSTIEDFRRDIAGAQGQNGQKGSAADELDAVVSATKQATDTIMSACEVMQNAAKDSKDPLANTVNFGVNRIFEACSFQDITGQRIRKVMKMLAEIESKVQGLLSGAPVAAVDQRQGDARLMNGPQLPGNAMSQADIDKLLADF